MSCLRLSDMQYNIMICAVLISSFMTLATVNSLLLSNYLSVSEPYSYRMHGVGHSLAIAILLSILVVL